jgi:uncharacterized membrane protein
METSVTDYQIISKPNNSLTSSQRIKLFGLLTVIPLLAAMGFALAGMWLILPFFGLEFLALGYAFYNIDCHAEDYESISLEDDRLVIERHIRNNTNQVVLNPYWVQLMAYDYSMGELHLSLRSHGKEVEIGHYMNNEQRMELAAQLRKIIGPDSSRLVK